MKLSKAIMTRITNASTTVQQLVFDALLELRSDVGSRREPRARAINGESSGRPGLMTVLELEQVDSYVRLSYPSGRPYRPDADTVAYAIAAVAGHDAAAIARWFGVEYEYAKVKLRRLREHAVKV